MFVCTIHIFMYDRPQQPPRLSLDLCTSPSRHNRQKKAKTTAHAFAIITIAVVDKGSTCVPSFQKSRCVAKVLYRIGGVAPKKKLMDTDSRREMCMYSCR